MPPFDLTGATCKVRRAKDAWNGRDPEAVSLAYTPDSRWRNRAEFLIGRPAIVDLLRRKWASEHGYRLIGEVWALAGDRIAVRFSYEWHDEAGRWFRSYGNENREFDPEGLMRCRIMVDPEDMGVAPALKRIGTAPEGMTLSRDQRTLYVIDRPNGTIHALDAATLDGRAQRMAG